MISHINTVPAHTPPSHLSYLSFHPSLYPCSAFISSFISLLLILCLLPCSWFVGDYLDSSLVPSWSDYPRITDITEGNARSCPSVMSSCCVSMCTVYAPVCGQAAVVWSVLMVMKVVGPGKMWRGGQVDHSEIHKWTQQHDDAWPVCSRAWANYSTHTHAHLFYHISDLETM